MFLLRGNPLDLSPAHAGDRFNNCRIHPEFGCLWRNDDLAYPEPSDVMSPHPPAKNLWLMRNINSLVTVTERIEGISMSFGAPNAGQGRNPTKVRSRTSPGDSTLLKGRALTDCGGIIFKRIHCVFEVLNVDVEKAGEFEFELSRLRQF